MDITARERTYFDLLENMDGYSRNHMKILRFATAYGSSPKIIAQQLREYDMSCYNTTATLNRYNAYGTVVEAPLSEQVEKLEKELERVRHMARNAQKAAETWQAQYEQALRSGSMSSMHKIQGDLRRSEALRMNQKATIERLYAKEKAVCVINKNNEMMKSDLTRLRRDLCRMNEDRGNMAAKANRYEQEALRFRELKDLLSLK